MQDSLQLIVLAPKQQNLQIFDLRISTSSRQTSPLLPLPPRSIACTGSSSCSSFSEQLHRSPSSKINDTPPPSTDCKRQGHQTRSGRGASGPGPAAPAAPAVPGHQKGRNPQKGLKNPYQALPLWRCGWVFPARLVEGMWRVRPSDFVLLWHFRSYMFPNR